MWDLVPWPGIEPRAPALGAWNLSYWITRAIPISDFWINRIVIWTHESVWYCWNLLFLLYVVRFCKRSCVLGKNIYSFIAGCKVLNMCIRSRVPKLQDIMPHDLRWSRYNNNGNKVNSKCNALESSPWVHGKTCLPWNLSLVPKRLGTAALDHYIVQIFYTLTHFWFALISQIWETYVKISVIVG